VPRRPLPEISAIARLPLRIDLVVGDDFEDSNRHMNVRFYFETMVGALGRDFPTVGIDKEYRETNNRGLFTAEHHLSYFAEVLVGEHVVVHTQVLDHSKSALHAVAYLVNESTGKLSCVLEAVVIHMDLSTRRAFAFPADIAVRLDELIAASAGLVEPSVLTGHMSTRLGPR
jgi:acyl-CoA thioester hydrolase